MVVALFAASLAMSGCGMIRSCQTSNPPSNDAHKRSEARSVPPNGVPESCAVCRRTMCTDPAEHGADLVAGCLSRPDPKLVHDAEPRFIERCRAAVTCAFEHNCAYDPALGPVHCYCGSRSLEDCLRQGPAADAPCVSEWQAATGSANHIQVLERFSRIEYPSGWAFSLLECDRDHCGRGAVPGGCTP